MIRFTIFNSIKQFIYSSLLLLFIYTGLSAGNLDSLKNIIQKISGTEKVERYCDIAVHYRRTDADSALHYGNLALNLAGELEYLEGKARALDNIGLALYFDGQYKEALEYFLQALEHRESLDNPRNTANTLSSIANIYQYFGSFTQAEKIYLQALEIRKNIGDDKGIATTLVNLGRLERSRGNYENALDNLLRCIDIYKRIGYDEGIAYAYNNISVLYTDLNENKKALEYANKSLSLYENMANSNGVALSLKSMGSIYRTIGNYELSLKSYQRSMKIYLDEGNQYGIANNLLEIGHTYLAGGNKEKALKYFRDALEAREKLNDKLGTASNLMLLGDIFLQSGKINEAADYFRQSLKIALSEEIKEISSESYQKLADIFARKGNFQSAYDYHKKFNEIYNALEEEKNAKKIARLHVKNEIEQREKQIEILKQQHRMKELSLERERIMRISFMVLMILAIGLAIVLFLLYRYKRQLNDQLTKNREGLIKLTNQLEERVKERTAELFLKNQTLKEEIKQRKIIEDQLKQAKEKAERSDSLKTEFLSQMSHEIRTPMHSILSFANFIREEFDDNIDKELAKSFSVMKEEGERIIKTIDSILIMSELQTGNFEIKLSIFDLQHEILGKIYKELKPVADNRKISFTMEENIDRFFIRGDEYSVEILLRNVIENALKFTEKGAISISTRRNIDYIEILVEDTGIGIDENYIEDIFEPFTTEETGYTRKFEGNGLGLAIARKLADLNGAKIYISSKKDSGTVFRIAFREARG